MIFSGGNGAQTIVGTLAGDTIYGHGSVDASPLSGQITATRIATGMAAPVFAGSNPADATGLYVLEKDEGRIIRIDTTTGAKTTFLDIPASQLSIDGERGLVGLAFHPDYATNRRFFVFMSDPDGDVVIKEYARSSSSALLANATPVKTILTIPHPDSNLHNGGTIAFGPNDGYLYISSGDGSSGGDPDNNAQNPELLLGKILRIDVDGDDYPADAGRNYAIPADNPFADGADGAPEVWDLGLRNPYRVSFDSATGDLWIADVGEATIEEINVHRDGTPGGLNFGWHIFEGSEPFEGGGPGPFTFPEHEYDHTVGRSITGGYVYRGPDPGLQGAYIYGDFIAGRIWALIDPGGDNEVVDLTSRIVGAGIPIQLITSFGVDARGELYVVSYLGDVYRLDLSKAAGDGDDKLYGGGGRDKIYGGAGNDILDGQGDNDMIWGGLGNDSIRGGSSADTMFGGAGNDVYELDNSSDRAIELAGEGTDIVRTSVSITAANPIGANIEHVQVTGSAAVLIVGGTTSNAITGNDAANRLLGMGGNDALLGGDGNDILVGGVGRDLLTGGDGIDAFHFDAIAELGKTAATRDVVLDFQVGIDDLDFNTMDANTGLTGNQNFVWRGSGAFTGVGQLRYYAVDAPGTANDKTIVQGNLDANLATAEFEVELSGYRVLGPGDFVL